MIIRLLDTAATNLFSFFLLVMTAFSWLLFPYFLHGDDLLFETGERARNEQLRSHTVLRNILTRQLFFPEGVSVTAVYVTEQYFRNFNQVTADGMHSSDTDLVFIINEDTTGRGLPSGLPETELIVDDRVFRPLSTEGLVTAGKHRNLITRFAGYDNDNQPIIKPDTSSVVLQLVRPWDRYALSDSDREEVESAWRWDLPLAIPEGVTAGQNLTIFMILSVAAGLLSSILTPCLMQLTLVFLATVGGLSTAEVINATAVTPAVRYRIMWKTVNFILVFVVLFIITGGLIGYAGKEAQIVYTEVNRSTGVVAGAVIILFGLWIGIRSRLPLVCKLPGAVLVQKAQGKGMPGLLVASFALSLGCISCYGGYIMGALIIYIGSLDSAVNGAAVLGLFATGVAVPFLFAAVFFTRMHNLHVFIGRHARAVGTVSMAVMVGFGILLVTNNYHEVSDYFYPYLGLD